MDKTPNFVPPCGAEQFAVYANWTKFLVLSGFSPLAIRERRRRTDRRRPVKAETSGRAAARAQHRRAARFGTAGAETSAAARHSKNGEKAAETRGRPPAISKRGGRSIKKRRRRCVKGGGTPWNLPFTQRRRQTKSALRCAGGFPPSQPCQHRRGGVRHRK